jgi:hypothetical protein
MPYKEQISYDLVLVECGWNLKSICAHSVRPQRYPATFRPRAGRGVQLAGSSLIVNLGVTEKGPVRMDGSTSDARNTYQMFGVLAPPQGKVAQGFAVSNVNLAQPKAGYALWA